MLLVTFEYVLFSMYDDKRISNEIIRILLKEILLFLILEGLYELVSLLIL